MSLNELGIPGLGGEVEEKVNETPEPEIEKVVEEKPDPTVAVLAQIEELRAANEKLAAQLEESNARAAEAVRLADEKEVDGPLDPEDDRENWPTIHINDVDGMPNYAQINTAGTKKNGSSFTHRMQIKRGEDVKVPPSVVDALRCAVADRVIHKKHPVTGKTIEVVTKQPAESWYLVNGGKYVK